MILMMIKRWYGWWYWDKNGMINTSCTHTFIVCIWSIFIFTFCWLFLEWTKLCWWYIIFLCINWLFDEILGSLGGLVILMDLIVHCSKIWIQGMLCIMYKSYFPVYIVIIVMYIIVPFFVKLLMVLILLVVAILMINGSRIGSEGSHERGLVRKREKYIELL